jgi:hypothetical protein
MEIRLGFFKSLFFHILRHLYYNFLNGRHTFMIFQHIRAISTAICYRKVTQIRRNRHASGQK